MTTDLHQVSVNDVWPDHSGHEMVVVMRGTVEYRLVALYQQDGDYYDEVTAEEPGIDPVSDIDSHYYWCNTCNCHLDPSEGATIGQGT